MEREFLVASAFLVPILLPILLQAIDGYGLGRSGTRKNPGSRLWRASGADPETVRHAPGMTPGGDGGIRTLDPGFGPDAPLAGECLRPLGHVSQTFGRAGSQRDEAKIIAARTAKVNVLGTFFVPDSSSTTQFIHIGRKECTKEGTKRKHQANARNKCTRRTGHSGRSCTPRFLKQITPDPVQTPYAARARRAPCISRRSAPKS